MIVFSSLSFFYFVFIAKATPILSFVKQKQLFGTLPYKQFLTPLLCPILSFQARQLRFLPKQEPRFCFCNKSRSMLFPPPAEQIMKETWIEIL